MWDSVGFVILGGFIGAFLTGVAKFIWEYLLPSEVALHRQKKMEREKFNLEIRDPSIRAVIELQDRIWKIVKEEKHKKANDEGFHDYYVTSTAFLFARLFACGEILRREASMLDYSTLYKYVTKVSDVVAHSDPSFRIFGLEQREIGERIIHSSPHRQDGYDIVEYAGFVDMLHEKNVPSCISQLLDKIRTFFDGDLPRKALVNIQHSLIEIMDEFLDPDFKWVKREYRKRI